MEDERDWGAKPFRFFNAWLEHKDCMKVMEDAWRINQTHRRKAMSLCMKMKELKAVLKTWAKDVFGSTQKRLEEIELELHKLDIQAEEGNSSASEVALRKTLKEELWKLNRAIESMWLQKSRINWQLLGDKNTKFFHSMASARQRKNLINSLSVEGIICEDPGQIKLAVFSHFQNLYEETMVVRRSIGEKWGGSIDSDLSNQLTAAFTEKEVWIIIKSCDGNKAPGPDGLNMLCIKKCWSFMKKDIMAFINEFHRNGKLPRGINSSFIALIPKIETAMNLSEYRPISLIGSMYKILSKVLAARIKNTIPVVVSEVQSAFSGGKNIQDGILIANEVVDGWKKGRKQGLIIKIDFEKAFDKLNWQYLWKMMKLMNFPRKWITWMKECLSSAWISVLVNGSPTKGFKMHKGVRQGDPLSPFLFIIAVEGLNWLFKRALNQGSFNGVKMGNEGLTLSHLQFADDTLVFCKASLEEVQVVKKLLEDFEEISGLKINFHKTSLCGVGVPEDNLQIFADTMGCQMHKLPIKYLGMPLGANPKRKSTWKPILDRFKSKLASWKRRYLSIGGRIVLIKSVLSSLPIFYMSLFKIPEGIVKALESIQAKFLWGGSELKRKLHLVGWPKITQAKSNVGLGIKNIKEMNDSLLLKWWWRYGMEKEALWKKVITTKYKANPSRWFPNSNLPRNASTIWKDIINTKVRNPFMHSLYMINTKIKVGDGKLTLFWLDPWLGNFLLAEAFPPIFNLVINQEESIHEVLARRTNTHQWDFHLRRNLFVWEKELFDEFLSVLDGSEILQSDGSEDKLSWLENGSASFTVKSIYDLANPSSIDLNSDFSHIWRNLAPYRVQCFIWLVLHGRVKTADFLFNLGIIHNVEDSLCKFCSIHSETLDHLFLHCDPVWTLWSNVLSWWGVKWVTPPSTKNLLSWWKVWKLKEDLGSYSNGCHMDCMEAKE